jgi:hypothetical protein
MEKLSTNNDAELILKLYELRTEPTMREARNWITTQFWPTTAAEFFAVQRASGTKENAYLRQVTSYWEMAAAFVLHGCLSAELFIDCNGENIFILAKLDPILSEITQELPGFLAKTREIVRKYPDAAAAYERALKGIARSRPVLQSS